MTDLVLFILEKVIVSKSQNVMRTNPLKVSKIYLLIMRAYFPCCCWYTKILFQFCSNLSQYGKGFLSSWFTFPKQMCWMQPCTSYILSIPIYQSSRHLYSILLLSKLHQTGIVYTRNDTIINAPKTVLVAQYTFW